MLLIVRCASTYLQKMLIAYVRTHVIWDMRGMVNGAALVALIPNFPVFVGVSMLIGEHIFILHVSRSRL